MKQEQEDFEFALTQYLDGTLPVEQGALVEERLRTDAAARTLLEEYRKLDEIICRAAAQNLPAVRWDRLAEQLSEAVADQTAGRVYSMPWVRVGLALAASLLLAVGIFDFWPHSQATGPVAIKSLQPVIVVVGPQAEQAAGPQTIDVSVGPPQEADAAQDYTSGDGVLVQRQMVALAGFTR